MEVHHILYCIRVLSEGNDNCPYHMSVPSHNSSVVLSRHFKAEIVDLNPDWPMEIKLFKFKYLYS